jgi:hypothetical protein
MDRHDSLNCPNTPSDTRLFISADQSQMYHFRNISEQWNPRDEGTGDKHGIDEHNRGQYGMPWD